MSIDTDYEVLRKVMDLKPEGWAVEFGVYSGYSLGIIAGQMPVIGFDSFRGLPEDWRPDFPKGTFALPDADEALVDMMFDGGMIGPNRMIVPGWFEDTVPTFPFPKLGLVHIDCDLYSSSLTALHGVVNALDLGTYVIFDEYHGYPGADQHEQKAWDEFSGFYDIEAETVAYGEQERAFEITRIAGRF